MNHAQRYVNWMGREAPSTRWTVEHDVDEQAAQLLRVKVSRGVDVVLDVDVAQLEALVAAARRVCDAAQLPGFGGRMALCEALTALHAVLPREVPRANLCPVTGGLHDYTTEDGRLAANCQRCGP